MPIPELQTLPPDGSVPVLLEATALTQPAMRCLHRSYASIQHQK